MLLFLLIVVGYASSQPAFFSCRACLYFSVLYSVFLCLFMVISVLSLLFRNVNVFMIACCVSFSSSKKHVSTWGRRLAWIRILAWGASDPEFESQRPHHNHHNYLSCRCTCLCSWLFLAHGRFEEYLCGFCFLLCGVNDMFKLLKSVDSELISVEKHQFS